MKRIVQMCMAFGLLFLILSCDREESVSEKAGRITLSFDKKEIPGGRTSDDRKPAAVYITVEGTHGKPVFENKKIALLEFGGGYFTENISLATGVYKLTTFLVLDDDDKVIYAAPLEGSEKAKLIDQALPISFKVTTDVTAEVKPQVLKITSSDTPESFGYTNFSFEVVDDGQTMPIKIKVELKVGEIMYLDVDTKITITGYTSDNTQQYQEEFAYVGPYENQFAVKSGYHHYTFELNHFGVYDKQINTGGHLLENSSGAVPVTYVMGGAVAAKKLSHYITYFERPDPAMPGNTIMVPDTKVAYQYTASGKPDRMTHYGYNAKTQQFNEARYFIFTYKNDRVEKLSGYLPTDDDWYTQDLYFYDNDGNVSRIEEENTTMGINTAVDLTYQYTNRVVKASYLNSEGNGFQYEVFYNYGNIATDKTTRWSQTCSEGTYSYDKMINPLKHLGYVDFLFRNYSVSNKIAEQVNYLGCSFPTLIPESYTYEYDAQGYPLKATTHYTSRTFRMETRYFYQ
jgi:hypothetical protein